MRQDEYFDALNAVHRIVVDALHDLGHEPITLRMYLAGIAAIEFEVQPTNSKTYLQFNASKYKRLIEEVRKVEV